MWQFIHYTWQIGKQIGGILLTMLLSELVGIELKPISIILIWFFFLVPPSARHQEWQWKNISAQYGVLLFVPFIAMFTPNQNLAILVWAVCVLVLPYVLATSVSLMMVIAIFLAGVEYILAPDAQISSYLVPMLVVSAIAYALSRFLLPFGNGKVIDRRIYDQTNRIFNLTKRNCVEKQPVTPKEFAQFHREYQLIEATIQSYQTWGIDVRARYRKHIVLYRYANELTSQAVTVLHQLNQTDAPEWVKGEFHQAQRIHRLLMETLYQDLEACPILHYTMPQQVADHQFSHSVAIYALTKYLTSLEQAVVIWQKELCHAKN